MSVRPPTQATSFSTGVPPRTQSAPPTNSTQPAGRGSLNATAQPFQPPPQNQNQNYPQPNPTLNPNINSMYTPQAPPYYPNDLAYPYPHQMHHYQYHQQYPYYPQTPAQNIHHHHHHVRGLMPHMHTYMHQPHHHHHHQSHLQHSHPPSHQHQQHHQHHHHQHHAQQKPDDSPKRQSNIWNVQSDLSGVRPVESPKTNQDNEEDSEVQSSEDTPQEENNQTAKQIQRTQQGNKKTYSVDFLLKFQNEQTNPPEKIKLFSEIYMPNADDNLPSPQRNRAGVSKKTKPSGSPTTTTPPQPSISSPLQGMNPTIQRYPPVQNNATPPPYYTKHQPITEYSHRAPDPYKPISPTEEIQTVAKKVVGILNRLTPEKYDVLMNEILLINFDTNNTELLNEIIRCVFECAVTQTSLSNMYADLCKDLTQKFAQAQKSKETEESGRSAYASFRRALLNKCQTEFEKPQTIPASSNLSKEERDEAESKLRQRQLGNIKFIGELFKRKMLTKKIMHEVIKRLLLGCPPKEDHVPSDEEIEVLCKLLTTVGIMLDRQQAHTYMNHYFEKMKKLLTNHPRQRIRFMLQDVIELRDMNWVPRREEQKPQTLSELENTMHRKQMEAQEQLSRPRINPVPNHIPANPTFSPTQLSPNNSPPPPAASSPIHQPSSPPQAKPPPLASTPKPKPEPTRKPQLAKPEPLPPTAAPAANPPKQSAVAPNTKTEKEPSAVNTVPHEVSKPQPKPKPKASEEEPVAPKLMDELALESAAHSLLEEFKNSTQESDLYDNLRQVGESNHLNLFRKAIEGSTTSLARHSTERKLLAGLLRQILQHEDESGAHKPLVSPKVIYGSFTAFVQHALDPEDGLLEDNPKLWECFADLLVQCFLENTFTYAALNYLIADDLFQHEQFLPFILALFRRLKQERNATLICCSGHFEILQKLFCATRTTERIEELLQNFQSSDLLEVDVTIYLYYCYKSRVPVDDILIRLQSRIPESLSTSSVISQKVASPTILYSAVATNLFVEASKKPEPRVLFSKLVELFNNQLTKPILKYTQNDSVDKLDNELQCLIEAQKFCYLTGYQGGILCNYFQVFYEVEVVMEDTYYMWRKQTNADYGKDQAVKEVQSFLSFLEKGDEEAGDDADAYDGAE